MGRFHHWTYLNQKGMEMFGEVFPSKEVPVISMIPIMMRLGGKPTRAYKVDLSQLSEEQKEKLLKLMAKKFNAPIEPIKAQIEKDGFIPLREELTSGSGTDQIGLFI